MDEDVVNFINIVNFQLCIFMKLIPLIFLLCDFLAIRLLGWRTWMNQLVIMRYAVKGTADFEAKKGTNNFYQ